MSCMEPVLILYVLSTDVLCAYTVCTALVNQQTSSKILSTKFDTQCIQHIGDNSECKNEKQVKMETAHMVLRR